jgi:uncharacterized protein YciI
MFLVLYRLVPGSAERRTELYPAHRSYIDTYRDQIALAGSTLGGDDTATGGLFLLTTDDVQEAQRFSKEDPFVEAGILEVAILEKFECR